jgi:hypothetical protein
LNYGAKHKRPYIAVPFFYKAVSDNYLLINSSYIFRVSLLSFQDISLGFERHLILKGNLIAVIMSNFPVSVEF